MNDPRLFAKEEYFPLQFFKIFANSVQAYRTAFANYFLLSLLVYIPFLLIDAFSPVDLLDLIDFLHGNFLDILIFLTIPTLLIGKKVLPIQTLTLFQRFFASAVIISFIQLGVLWLFVGMFFAISAALALFGLMPYIFILFAGFFLVLENKSSLISVGENLSSSFKLVRLNFLHIFWAFVLITLSISIPALIFSMIYLTNHSEWVAFFQGVDETSQADAAFLSELFKIIKDIITEPGYKIGRIALHILLRPLKSLFLSLLFLGIIVKIAPKLAESFFVALAPKNGEPLVHPHEEGAEEFQTESVEPQRQEEQEEKVENAGPKLEEVDKAQETIPDEQKTVDFSIEQEGKPPQEDVLKPKWEDLGINNEEKPETDPAEDKKDSKND